MHLGRILPQLMSQRSHRFDLRVAETQLYHFLPGDPCEHRGRPETFPIVQKLLALLLLPRLPRLWPAASKQHSNGGDLKSNARNFFWVWFFFKHWGTSRASTLKFAGVSLEVGLIFGFSLVSTGIFLGPNLTSLGVQSQTNFPKPNDLFRQCETQRGILFPPLHRQPKVRQS